MHESSAARSVFHPELCAALAVIGGVFPPTITPELIPFMRRAYASPPRAELLAGRDLRIDDIEVPGWGTSLEASVVRPAEGGSGAGILLLHSGGMMFGDRFSGADHALSWVDKLGAVLVTVDYRLAPEHPDPAPFEDCYATLEWFASHAHRFGVSAGRILVAGASAGGGLAAGVALAARDRGGPRLCGQLLDYPMLDDRGLTPSTFAFDGVGVWDRISNETGWQALLGERVGGSDVSPYAAPSRAEDLRDLPPTFIDVGSAEIFRDEAVDYARRLWEAGVDTELHVWPGAFHACDIFAAHTTIARAMIHAREDWLHRTLAD
ncbi:Carboxylesterase NlhH [Microbacterium laevaniformans]|uniref:Carboxylesterase NlhH n=1 Tax=Microbacterium laevaniformans TaxID=36807 RepID=A0A150HHB6_9MICO|nr:alpha/beta hydrolase fold domain-containing protein [Microbacterium laevaniformans]KXZ61314.1 Carboxylesterase NlhH [Microbacterium laevaniformans]